MSFLAFLIKDLLKRKVRLILTLAGVSVGIAACVMMLGLSEGIRGSFKYSYGERRVDIVVYEKDEFNLFSSRVPFSLIGDLREIPQVEDATGVLIDLQRFKHSFILVFGWPETSPHFGNIKIVDGRKPKAGEHEVIVGADLARSAPVSLAETIRMRGDAFTVAGIYESNSPFEKSGMIMPLDAFQAMDPDKREVVTSVDIVLKEGHRNERGIGEVAGKIEALYPGVSAQNADVFIREKTKQMIMGERLSLLIAIITIVAVILGLANTMLTSAFEKRKLIGVLIALGWEKKDVIQIVFLETLLISLLGGFIGMTVGRWSMDYIFRTMDLALLMPAWDNILLLKIVGFILLSGVVAALVPSWIIVNVDPVEVIRSE